MPDNHSKEARSYNMSRIRSKDTKPEKLVRLFLFSRGFRYRKNDARLPGKPDIYLPKYKTVIFINGCFWHKHEGCVKFVWPKNNAEYWAKKIEGNVSRDKRNYAELSQMGLKVIVIWECELKKANFEFAMEKLVRSITSQDKQ
ncbi:MAG: DNA mismatch endonuclease Vsr [Clostridia bacterium]|nr:DNA mismatch endonuclease Vsr [Clostridia bacterium]